MARIAIIAARRTPQGRFLGSLARLSAVDLAVAAGQAALGDLPEPKLAKSVDLTIVGNVLSAGAGMNVARQVAVKLGLPIEGTAFSVNMMCASGMKAIALGCQAIEAGAARMVLCGGTESMSQTPHLLPRSRMGFKLGDAKLVDSLLNDGLVDAFDHQHMGLSAERLAREYSLSRTDQDAFAARSQRLYAETAAAGRFAAEIVSVTGLGADEHPRADTTVESLAKLAPAFDPGGTVTAGNASGINDGAALVVLCDAAFAASHGIKPLAMIEDYAEAGCDPARMGLGPVHATRKLLDKSGCRIEDFDAIEINEAFAAQTLSCVHELGLDPDSNSVNIDGGAIALGHPIGASGARLIVHLAHRIASGLSNQALASLCVGGGMGVAARLTRP
ncbi:acetyl-CoA C-acyltransferase [bacterium]|nr:acetyl-CoA C-acyltransferase [bacterium]